jgi:hypothetical protein
MAKRRLLQWMRDRLVSHAEKTVAPAKETKAFDAAYAKAEPLVRKIVEAKFKPADMAICEKYGVARRDQCIRVQLADGSVEEFSFVDKEASPLVVGRSCYDRMYVADAKASAAIEAWKAARDALEDEKKRRVAAYTALVAASTTIEDIAAVWPEAAIVLPPATDLIPLGPEQIALVETDMRERKAA